MNFINTLDITVINLKKGLSNTLHHKTNSNLSYWSTRASAWVFSFIIHHVILTQNPPREGYRWQTTKSGDWAGKKLTSGFGNWTRRKHRGRHGAGVPPGKVWNCSTFGPFSYRDFSADRRTDEGFDYQKGSHQFQAPAGAVQASNRRRRLLYCFQIEPVKFNLKGTAYRRCRFHDFQVRKSWNPVSLWSSYQKLQPFDLKFLIEYQY